MLELRKVESITARDVAVVRALAAAAESHDGHSAFGESVWRDLQHAAAGSHGFLATERGEAVGYLHAISEDPSRRALAVVIGPGASDARTVNGRLLDAEIEDAIAAGAVDALVLWKFGVADGGCAGAETRGFRVERELWQMRVTLPLAEDARLPAGVTLRTFVPGSDDNAWLAVNNRSFAHDPDQGGWAPATLAARMAEPWFDPAGFFLAHDGEGLAGFCWTKVHPAVPPHEPEALGEIYVIGVDPARHGRGLGRALVVTGLAHLAERGIRRGMLFVDAANAPAVALYHKLGFAKHRVDREYHRDLA